MRIGIKILMSFLVIIISITVMGFTSVTSSQERIIDEIGGNYAEALHVTIVNIDDKFKNDVFGLLSSSDRSFVTDFIISLNAQSDVSVETNELSIKLQETSNFLESKFGYPIYEDVSVADSTGNHLLTFGSKGSGDGQFKSDGPYGIAVDSAGNIWVADTKNHRIQKFDSSGNFLLKFGANGSGDTQFRQPNALAIDSFDNVWIADTNNDRIVAYDSSGNFLTKYGTKNAATGFGDNGPRGIAFEAGSSTFYVTDTKKNTIHKFQNNLTPVANVPGVPTGLIAVPGNTEVALSWTAPSENGGAEIDYYTVLSREVGSGSWSLLGNIPGTSATVTGLTNDQEYEFAVSAHNSAGVGTAASTTATPVNNNSEVPTPGEPHTVNSEKPILTIEDSILPSSVDAGIIEAEFDFTSLIVDNEVTITSGTDTTSTIDGNTVELKIHDNTKITFPDGTTNFKIPKDSSQSAGNLGTATNVIEFGGNSNERITFDTPLRLLIPGIGGDNVFFSGVDNAGNSVTSQVTTVCTADTLVAVSSQIQFGTAVEECHITSGNDEIIWTTHASAWGGYDASAVVPNAQLD
jgi:hypothetical protein